MRRPASRAADGTCGGPGGPAARCGSRGVLPSGQKRSGFSVWGAWLLTFGIVYSAMSSLPHTTYMASLAPPIAALSGAGIVLFWRWHRAGTWRTWMLPSAIVAELNWATYLNSRNTSNSHREPPRITGTIPGSTNRGGRSVRPMLDD